MRYFFDLRNGDGGFADRAGVDLPDGEAAAKHARCVGAELIRNRETTARYWQIHVRDQSGGVIAVLPLLAMDRTLQHLGAPLRKTMEEVCLRRYALGEAMDAARLTWRKSKSLIARSRRKPHLVCDQGEFL